MGMVRSLSNYASITFIPFATYIVLKKANGLNEKIVKKILICWFIVAMAQMLIDKELFSIFVSGGRTTDSRGVFGLASEPSFFGICCFFFLFLVDDFKEKRIQYLILVIGMGVFLAQSSMGILCIAAYIGILFLKRANKISSICMIGSIIVIGVVSVYYVIQNYMIGTRVYYLLNTFLFNRSVFWADESVRQRLNDIIIPMRSVIQNNFLPHGFGGRIMSGYGATLYEIGFVGIAIIIIIAISIGYLGKSKISKILNPIIVTIIMFAAIQLAHPMLGFIVGYGWYKNRQDKKIKILDKRMIIQ